MRRMLRVAIDAMQHRLAAADVIGDVLDVVGAADAGREIEAHDLEADAVSALERIRGRHDLDRIFVDLARHDRLLRFARERMPGPSGQRALAIDRAMRGLEPAARELALVQPRRDIALALARG